METGKWLPVISDSATGPKFLQFLLVWAWEKVYKDIASILVVTFHDLPSSDVLQEAVHWGGKLSSSGKLLLSSETHEARRKCRGKTFLFFGHVHQFVTRICLSRRIITEL